MKLYNHLRILLTLLLASTLQYSQAQKEEDYFITLWDLRLNTSDNNSISFNSSTSGIVNYTWETVPAGQSGSGTYSINNGSVLINKLPSNSKIKLKIAPQNLQRFYFDNNYSNSSHRLIDVLQWGKVQWTSMEKAFYECENLNITATDLPDLSKVISINSMFLRCFKLNGPNNIGSWDTRNIKDMGNTFSCAEYFNQSIGNWDTKNVIDMSYMFNCAKHFNQPIDSWNTQNVINMNAMFRYATAFNQPIGKWDTENVDDMSEMFYYAESFNQPIGKWNTQNVTNMSEMFYYAESFNQPIGKWNTQNVTNMSEMFYSASSFNQPIDKWNTQNVINMNGLFCGAKHFNQDIGNWNTQNARNMGSMLAGAIYFNQDIGTWNTQNVTNMSGMFGHAISFNQPIDKWNTENVINMNAMFRYATAFNQPIGKWDTENVDDMGEMFYYAVSFNQPLNTWNTNNVLNMYAMFFNAKSFNQKLDSLSFNDHLSFYDRFNPSLRYFLDSCGIDCNNYSLTLMAWEKKVTIPYLKSIGASGLKYSKSAKSARDFLTKPISEGGKGWTISGDLMVDDDCGLITSTEENWVSSGWSIYPNPAQELLYIKNIPENTAYQIIDAMGREVLSGYCNDEQIPLPKLSQGLYSLRIAKQQKHFVKE